MPMEIRNLKRIVEFLITSICAFGRVTCLLMMVGAVLPQSVAGSQQYDAAMQAIRAKDYSVAIELLEALVDQGDPESQYQLASLYRTGMGVTRNYQTSAELFAKAAEQGHPEAQCALGGMYEKGLGCQQDYDQARYFYTAAISGGSSLAKKKLEALDSLAKTTKLTSLNPAQGKISTADNTPVEYTPASLHWAARNGNTAAITELIQHGVKIDERDDHGRTSLLEAAMFGQAEAVNELLVLGADFKLRDKDGYSPLDAAAAASTALHGGTPGRKSADHARCIIALLRRGADPSQKGPRGNTPLMLSAEKGNVSVVSLLLRGGAQVNVCNQEGITALDIALLHGFDEAARQLSAAGAKKNAIKVKDAPKFPEIVERLAADQFSEQSNNAPSEWTLPMMLAYRGQTETLRQLLLTDKDEAVNLTDKTGKTALHLAAMQGNEDVVSLLLAHGANPNIADNSGALPLFYAAKFGHSATIDPLLVSENDPCSGSVQEKTPLLAAIANKHEPTAMHLLHAGMYCESSRIEGATALHLAATQGMTGLLTELIGVGANIEVPDSDGSTALVVAAKKGDTKIVEILLESGALINATDNSGNSALAYAASHGDQETVATLLAHGANVNLSNKSGNTPLSLAADNGLSEMSVLLIKSKADINHRNNIGNTPLMLAAASNHKQIVQILLENGANVSIKNKKNEKAINLAANDNGTKEIIENYISKKPLIERIFL